MQMYHARQARKLDAVFIKKKKRISHQGNLTISVDHRLKIKSRITGQLVQPCKETINVFNIYVTVSPIQVSAFVTVPKNLKKS